MPASSKKSQHSKLHLLLMSLFSFSIGFLMSYDAAMMRENSLMNATEKNTSEQDSFPPSQYSIPSTTIDLLGNIAIQKRIIMQKLTKEYGQFTREIYRLANLNNMFHISTLSRKRLIRKLMIKILQARRIKPSYSYAHIDDFPVFHWVTSGDSSAAGHGNAYLDSYTTVLENTVRDMFHSAGIKFIAGNRAGDMWSGIELGMCMEYILGKNVDAMSWDFMPLLDVSNPSEGSAQALHPLSFGERVGRVMPKLPFLFFLQKDSNAETVKQLNGLEGRGMGVGVMDEDTLREVIMTFPDCNVSPDIHVPAAIKMIRCNDKIEGRERCNNPEQSFWCDSNEATECVNTKFNGPSHCQHDRYQISKNDGWKMHKLKGRLIGFFLIDMLHHAALEIDTLERQEPGQYTMPEDTIQKLEAEEESEKFLFLKTQPSPVEHSRFSSSLENLLFKDAFCLTSISSQQSIPLEFDPPAEYSCEEFIPFQNIFLRISDNTGSLHIDTLSSRHQVTKQTMPDKLEDGFFIGVCLKKCYGNYCKEDEILIDWSAIDVQVNENPVSRIESFGGCSFFESNGSLLWSNSITSDSGINIEISTRGKTLLMTSVFTLS